MYWVFFVLLLPLNYILPASWGRENGVVETLQLVLLAACIGVFVRSYSWRLVDWHGDKKSLCCSGGITFFLLLMREISWGRVLILRPDGSSSQYSDLGLYGQLVHPMIAVLIIVALICLYRARVWRIFKFVKLRYKYILALVLFIVMARVAECHLVAWYSGNLAEELAELGAYMMLLYLLRDGFKKLRVR